MGHRGFQFGRGPAKGVLIQTWEVVWEKLDRDNVGVSVRVQVMVEPRIVKVVSPSWRPSSAALGLAVDALGPSTARCWEELHRGGGEHLCGRLFRPPLVDAPAVSVTADFYVEAI